MDVPLRASAVADEPQIAAGSTSTSDGSSRRGLCSWRCAGRTVLACLVLAILYFIQGPVVKLAQEGFDDMSRAGLQMCPKDTHGGCFLFDCPEWRNARCVKGHCICGADECSVAGQCLPAIIANPGTRPSHDVNGPGHHTALVLSGGGAKGAYEIGVLEGLCRNDSMKDFRKWSMIVGTSIGALNAGALAQFSPDDQCSQAIPAAQRFWDSIKAPEDVWVSSQLGPGAASNTDSREPCFGALQSVSMAMAFWHKGGLCDPTPGRTAFEFAVKSERIRSSGMALRVVATSLATGKPVWWDETSESIIEGCEASGAIAPLVYPKEVDGQWYIDGGFVTNTPIMQALKDGAQRVLVVELDSYSTSKFIPDVEALKKADINVGLRIVEFEASLMQQRYFLEHELELACAGYPDRRILGFQPRSSVGETADFSASGIKRMREEGLRAVRENGLVDLCRFFEVQLDAVQLSAQAPASRGFGSMLLGGIALGMLLGAALMWPLLREGARRPSLPEPLFP